MVTGEACAKIEELEGKPLFPHQETGVALHYRVVYCSSLVNSETV